MARHRQERPEVPTIGERIRDRRELLGLTVRGAALAAGLSHPTWSRIERGQRGADNRFVLARMAEALRYPVSDLTGERAARDTREAAATKVAITEAFRAIVAADPVMTALAAFQLAHSSSACGVYPYARAVASGAAEALRGHGAQPGSQELLGMLLLTSAYACYGGGTPGDAAAYVDEARHAWPRVLATRWH